MTPPDVPIINPPEIETVSVQGLNSRNSGFDICEFKAKALGEAGVMRSNMFLVNIYPPAALSGLLGESDASAMASFLCEATALPGVSLFLQSGLQRYGYGPLEKKPMGAIFDDHNFYFISDGAGRIYEFFQKWIMFIANYDSSSSRVTMSSDNSTGAFPYEMRYRDDYEATVEIVMFTPTGEEVIKTTLGHAFPTHIGAVPLAWSSQDQYVRIPVLFTFRDWSFERMNVASGSSILGRLGSQIINLLSNPKALNTKSIVGIADNFARNLINEI